MIGGPSTVASVGQESDGDDLGRRISELVSQRRDAGEYPDDLEQWMDEHFARVAGRTSDALLAAAQAAAAQLQAQPPFHLSTVSTSSRFPGGTAVHRAVAVAVRRHLDEVVTQMNDFAGEVRHAVAAVAEATTVHRSLAGQLQSIDDQLAEIRRTLNRLADAHDGGSGG